MFLIWEAMVICIWEAMVMCPPSGMKLRGKDKGKPLEAKAEKASAAKKK